VAQLAVPRTDVPRKSPLVSRKFREGVMGYLFAAPFIIGFLGMTLGPMLYSIYASLDPKYDLTHPPHFRSFSNYTFILQHDPDFRKALYNTFWYVIFKTPTVIIVALAIALLMNQNVPGIKVFRTIYYMPTVITGVAAIFLWVWILNPNGVLDTSIAKILPWQNIQIPNPAHSLCSGHILCPQRLLDIQQPIGWFLDPNWAKPGLVIMGVWYIGAPMLILLAGLTGIPRQLYEAAEVDGAGMFREFRNSTLPMLSPTLFCIILTNISGACQICNSAYVISTSGNGN